MRTVRELQGMSCISLEQAPPPKKQIACTRSFGHAITTLPPLIEAVSEFTTRAAEKLRHGGQRAGALQVFAHTSPFRPGPRFYKSAIISLKPSSSDTKVLVGAAVAGLRSIYEPGYQLAKAGVMLLDLGSAVVEQRELLFAEPGASRDPSPLMEVIDRINGRWGQSHGACRQHRRYRDECVGLEDEAGAQDTTLHHGVGRSADCTGLMTWFQLFLRRLGSGPAITSATATRPTHIDLGIRHERFPGFKKFSLQ